MSASDQPREAGEGHTPNRLVDSAINYLRPAQGAPVTDAEIAADILIQAHASDQAKIKGLREALEDSNNHLSALLAIFRHKLPPATERSIELRIGKNRRAALKQSQP